VYKVIFIAVSLLLLMLLIADPPDWSFGVEPLSIMESFYDYMPGGHNYLPVQIQQTGASGDNGVYIVFYAQPTATDNRNVYLAYIAPNDSAQVWDAGLANYAGGARLPGQGRTQRGMEWQG